jgi:hypothetical protein
MKLVSFRGSSPIGQFGWLAPMGTIPLLDGAYEYGHVLAAIESQWTRKKSPAGSLKLQVCKTLREVADCEYFFEGLLWGSELDHGSMLTPIDWEKDTQGVGSSLYYLGSATARSQ